MSGEDDQEITIGKADIVLGGRPTSEGGVQSLYFHSLLVELLQAGYLQLNKVQQAHVQVQLQDLIGREWSSTIKVFDWDEDDEDEPIVQVHINESLVRAGMHRALETIHQESLESNDETSKEQEQAQDQDRKSVV